MLRYSNCYWEVHRRFQGDFFGLEVVGGGEDRGVTWEDLDMEKFVMGADNFLEGGAGYSSAILNKNKTIKK